MRVKKLDIFGFKSFGTRQSIVFGDGVTGIVGPNGCGKSNVVDALRWVMGEQNARHLRGGNMQDIIFCGSEKKSALGYAEVKLTIENNSKDAPLEYNHFSEIEICRKLYKSGESEYEINRQKARLKDITEFFMGTGVGTKAYSIIEQGRVNEVISAKPMDRRSIIEEAAGITKYKAKKIIAERRIEATRTNLNRIIDIRNEIEKRVNSLLKDKEKLEQVNEVKMRIKNIDLHISSHQYLFNLAKLNFSNRSIDDFGHKIQEYQREIAFIEQNFSSVLNEYSEKNNQKRLLEDLLAQHKNSAGLLGKDLEYIQQTLNDNANFIARAENQLTDLDERFALLNQEQENYKAMLEQALTEQGEITEKLNIKKNGGSQVIALRLEFAQKERDNNTKLVSAASLASRMQAEIKSLEEQEQRHKNESRKTDEQLEQISSELEKSEEQIIKFDQDFLAGQKKEEELKATISKMEAHKGALGLQEKEEEKAVAEVEKELRQASARLESLLQINQNMEWSDSGAAFLRSQKNFRGVVADAITVTSEHAPMVEKCLGHILDAVLLNKKEDLKESNLLLKNNKSATTNFFLLDEIDSFSSAKPLGLKNILEIISINDTKYEKLKPKLARYYYAENFELALEHWPAAKLAQVFIVTALGEMLCPDGRAIIFGQANTQGVLARKNEISALQKQKKQLEAELLKRKTKLEQTLEKLKEVELNHKSQIEEMRMLSLGLIRVEEALKQKKREHSRLENEKIKLLELKTNLQNLFLGNEEKQARLKQDWANALSEHKDLEENIEKIKVERAKAEAEYEDYQGSLKELEIIFAGSQEKCQGLKTALNQARSSMEHTKNQIEVFKNDMLDKSQEELKLLERKRQAEKKLEKLGKETSDCDKQLEIISKECFELREKKHGIENSLAKYKNNIDKAQAQLNECRIKVNNIENELKNLSDKIFERYKLALAEYLSDYHHVALDEQVAKRELENLKRALDKMGSVNENAAKEFDEFKARKDFLDGQIADLEDALNQLESAIKKINKTTKMRFLEAFNNINKQFSQVFPRLFNGGRAELVLTNPEDLLTAGVDIIAKPPGKNIGSIELMSGGEKALTAISLIMAIFLIKPSPFCLLDEVDAPLDEANVSRFSQLIKEMSELSQFIVITHNRKTMESSDHLYGVTMEDAGSSKIVSVHVQQAFESFKTSSPSKKSPRLSTQQLFMDDLLS